MEGILTMSQKEIDRLHIVKKNRIKRDKSRGRVKVNRNK